MRVAEIRRRANPSQGRAVSPQSGHSRESRRPCRAGAGHLGECFPNREAPDSPELLCPHKWVFSPVRGSICLLVKMIQGPLPHKTHVPPSEPAPISPPGFQATSPGKPQHKPAWFHRAQKGGRQVAPQKLQDPASWYQRELRCPHGNRGHFQGSRGIRLEKGGCLRVQNYLESFPQESSCTSPPFLEGARRRTPTPQSCMLISTAGLPPGEPACAWCSERAFVSVLTPPSLPTQRSQLTVHFPMLCHCLSFDIAYVPFKFLLHFPELMQKRSFPFFFHF